MCVGTENPSFQGFIFQVAMAHQSPVMQGAAPVPMDTASTTAPIHASVSTHACIPSRAIQEQESKSASQVLDRVREALEERAVSYRCSICYQCDVEHQIMVPCGHGACRTCLDRIPRCTRQTCTMCSDNLRGPHCHVCRQRFASRIPNRGLVDAFAKEHVLLQLVLKDQKATHQPVTPAAALRYYADLWPATGPVNELTQWTLQLLRQAWISSVHNAANALFRDPLPVPATTVAPAGTVCLSSMKK